MPKKKQPPVQQTAIGDGNVQIFGDKNVVNQPIIQKFFNIFKSDAEVLEQRNRRIMLGHVENFWVKGILEKSLHGAALLELGIKEDPAAVKTYPWAIKREATKETLPAGMSMLKIFQEIGMGRSLLILGAPGSGKTTMLLELSRQLIERAREDMTEPIPVVFNLSSWTEGLNLADWLARELNTIYYVPKKVAPTWVKENKMLLLLDGLDEVRQESRDQCVDAINQFRKENGLTSMAVCSRMQDYAELKAKLSFDGAIEIQTLTSKQVDGYFKRFGKGLAGIWQALEKDNVLREMAETPLFLNIMMLAYKDTQSKDILVSENVDLPREQLFDIYIARMFERPERSINESFNKQDVLHWLSWLAQKMIEQNAVPYLLENMQFNWLDRKKQMMYRLGVLLLYCLLYGLVFSLLFGVFGGQIYGLICGLLYGLIIILPTRLRKIEAVDALVLNWKGGIIFLISGLGVGFLLSLLWRQGIWLGLGLSLGLGLGLSVGLNKKQISQTTYPGQKISFSIRNFLFVVLVFGPSVVLIVGAYMWWLGWLSDTTFAGSYVYYGMIATLIIGLFAGLLYGGDTVIQHYTLHLVIARNNLLPWRLVAFLDHCVDLIFLRRVGGGYIFVHRLLMEHFAAMYQEEAK